MAYWYDPMVQDQHFDKPGKSPFMDMELVPKYGDEGGGTGGAGAGGPPAVTVNPAAMQNLGLRVVAAKRDTLATLRSIHNSNSASNPGRGRLDTVTVTGSGASTGKRSVSKSPVSESVDMAIREMKRFAHYIGSRS